MLLTYYRILLMEMGDGELKIVEEKDAEDGDGKEDEGEESMMLKGV